MGSEKLPQQTLGWTIVLLVLAGCGGGMQVTPTATAFPAYTAFPTSALALSTSTPAPVPSPMPTLQPMSIRGILLDMEGNPVADQSVVLCYERESSTGVILEPVPQDFETMAGSWAGGTNDQGVFVLGASAGQPDMHPSSGVPGDRYALVIGLTPRSGEWPRSCSPYVVQGNVYFGDCSLDADDPETDETLWFTLEDGYALDLGTMVYAKEGTGSACCH